MPIGEVAQLSPQSQAGSARDADATSRNTAGSIEAPGLEYPELTIQLGPTEQTGEWPLSRRSLLRCGLLACLGVGTGPAWAGAPPERMPPRPGDHLVWSELERRGEVLRAADLVVGSAPVPAWPVDPASGRIRDGSRLNQVRLVRIDPASLSPETRSRSAEGILAFSSICTHTGCEVTGWEAESCRLVCPCHGSQFDVREAARVLVGPAPRPLAMLPLEIVDEVLVVKAPFSRRVGFQPA
jgi:nitrite reductase/ring-hydroxylating ferredoxin subunit